MSKQFGKYAIAIWDDGRAIAIWGCGDVRSLIWGCGDVRSLIWGMWGVRSLLYYE
ncbi:hypothetical protein VB713_01920 [Anabaena cylindrica UHCC 0172]|uniref:hypothetical protein n=1 Tax=Anabaena cylindrica TaxID=1165 RepID=UPI002B2042CB|nr:hypothetical protein [Anabaena cylindrica]MEA5549748.1 hypothetical protein [Anabaena cylindrica UHCC 0172]